MRLVRISDKHGIMSQVYCADCVKESANNGLKDISVLILILEKVMKLMKNLGILTGALFLLTCGVGASQAADTSALSKVAVVNVQQVLQQSPRVAELSKKLEAEFKPRQTKVNDQQKALQAQIDKFEKESPTMSQKDKDSVQKKITGERQDLVKQVVALQQDFQKEQNKVMQNILGDVNSIVSSIAKNNNYTIVFDSSAVIYSATSNDITKDVAKQFNNKT